MTTTTAPVAGATARTRIAVILSVLVAIVATGLSVLLSVGVCVGSEGAGVAAGSVRGQACDIPAVGPWLYPLAVGALALACALTTLLRRRPEGVRLWVVALLPAAAVLVVPAVLALLPR